MIEIMSDGKLDFSIVQVTDVHVRDDCTARTFIADIDEINSLPERPAFVVTTGDLVDNGSRIEQFEDYKRSAREYKMPLYNAIGNHDVVGPAFAPEQITNFADHIGKTYYSFDFKNKHFIVSDYHKPQEYTEWLKADLAGQPKSRDIIVFQHVPPDKPLLDFLSDYNTKALFYGDWHSNKTFYYGKILAAGTPPLCYGGIDLSPRGFRIIDFYKDGSIATDYRLGGIRKLLNIVKPGSEVTAKNGLLPVRVNIYDTVEKIKKVECAIDKRRVKSMTSAGGWLWQTEYDMREIPPGRHVLRVKAIAESGASWEKEEELGLVEESSSESELCLLWMQYAGNNTGMSSPVACGDKIYIGVQDDDNAKRGGVTCLDKATGRIIWKFTCGESINGSPAVSDNILCAVSVKGTVFGLDAVSGKELWRYNLGDGCAPWIYNSPVVSEGAAYCGAVPYFAALDLRTGREIWRAFLSVSNWISCRASPVVDDKHVYIASTWSEGFFALEKKSGSIAWIKKEGFRTTHSTPVVCGDKLYFAADDKLYALERDTGKEIWNHTLKEWWLYSSPVVKDSVVFMGLPNGRLVAIDSEAGRELWSYQVDGAIGSFSTSYRGEKQVMPTPIVYENKIILGANDGNIHVLDLKTGAKLLKYQLGAPILSSPAISDSMLYVSTYDGNIYCFKMDIK